MTILTPLMMLVVLGVTLLGCVSDFRFLRIPNWHTFVILGCFFPAYFAMPEVFHGLGQHLGAMAGMFAVTYIMFTLNMMGGGDSKFGTALGLWVGLKGLLPFLFYMAVMGGILGGLALLMRKKKIFKSPPPESWAGQINDGKNAVPYGIAISFGFWMALFHTGFIHASIGALLKAMH